MYLEKCASILVATLTVTLTGCNLDEGGGSSSGSGGGDGGSSDLSGPQTDIFFPPAGAYTQHNFLPVRGRTTDPSGVEQVVVNNIKASTENDYWDWSIDQMPVGWTGELETVADDKEGNQATSLHPVNGGRMVLLCPTEIARDTSRGRTIVVDEAWRRIFSVDEQGDVTTLAPQPGQWLTIPNDLCYAAEIDMLIALETWTKRIVGYDPDDGTVTTLSGPDKGSGPLFDEGVTVTPGIGGVAYVLDANFYQSGNAVLRLDLLTGNREILCLDELSDGPDMVSPVDMVLDTANGRLLVLDQGAKSIVSVSLETGERAVVANGSEEPEGPAWGELRGLEVDPGGEAAWVLDAEDFRIWQVDLTTGSSFVSSDMNDGPSIGDPQEMLLTPGQSLLIAQRKWPALVSVDLQSGARTLSYETRIGDGPAWFTPCVAGLAEGRDELYITDSTFERVRAVSLIDGSRRVLADDYEATIRAGAVLDDTTLIAIDDQPGNQTLAAYDLETGVRTTISGGGVGWGPTLDAAIDLAIDPYSRKAYVLEWKEGDQNSTCILGVDIDTGERYEVAKNLGGFGAWMVEPSDIIWDPDGWRLFMPDPKQGIMLAVALDGEKTVFSGLAGVPVTTAVMDNDNDRIIAASSTGSLFGISLFDGKAYPMYDASSTTAGPMAGEVELIGRSQKRGQVYMLSRTFPGILAVDYENGHHVVMSLGGN